MSELKYFIEVLKPISSLEWGEEGVDTFAWVRLPNHDFTAVTDACEHVQDNLDKRLSYRITDGGRIWPVYLRSNYDPIQNT